MSQITALSKKKIQKLEEVVKETDADCEKW
jgi:hypothetical protein